MQDKLKTLEEAATQVKSGTRLVMSANMQRSPMAFLREVVRQRADNLRVIGVVGGEINIDFLIGADAVSVVDWAASPLANSPAPVRTSPATSWRAACERSTIREGCSFRRPRLGLWECLTSPSSDWSGRIC